MSMPTIDTVTAMPPATLKAVLANGKTLIANVGHLFSLPGHERLAEPAVFADVAVGEWGHEVTWPAIDQGVPVDKLIRLAAEQSGQSFPVVEFNAWMRRNGLSLSDAARILGLTRRMIIYYHGGHKPIPKHIGLACVGWDLTEGRQAA